MTLTPDEILWLKKQYRRLIPKLSSAEKKQMLAIIKRVTKIKQ